MWKKLLFTIEEFNRDEIVTRASSLAYYTALAMAPLIVLFVWSISIIKPELQGELVAQVGGWVGDDAAKLVKTIIDGADDRPDLSSLSGWLGLGGLLFSASVIFVQLQETLNVIFDAEKNPQPTKSAFWSSVKTMIFSRIFSVGMLLTFVFLATTSLLVSFVIAFLFRGPEAEAFQSILFGANFILFTLLFALMFKWMPDRTVKFTNALAGGAITSALFLAGKMAIGFYLARVSVGSAYGAAGSLAVLLVWVFYSSLIFFLGAEFSYTLLVGGARATKT